MERLFRDRMEFVTGPRDGECFICRAVSSNDDAATLVLGRGRHSVIILNAFPYNSGHVMVAPSRHVAEMKEMTAEERLELIDLTSSTVEALREELGAAGFNVGANLGEVAGAGLPGHFHMHIVPRWPGDTNFLPVIGGAKVIPELIEQTFHRLRGKIAGSSAG